MPKPPPLFIRVLLSLALIGVSHVSFAAQILIASAANFRPALEQIKIEFEQQSPHTLKLVFASSGKLYAQIHQGAPYHVFLSADQHKPKALVAAGLARERFTYATGRLVLYSHNKNLIDAKQLDINPTKLADIPFSHFALANPKLAPYGRASLEVLDKVAPSMNRKKWINGENINQSFQFIASANAQLGFISYAQLQQLKRTLNPTSIGSYWLVPEVLHSPIKQDAVMLLNRPNPDASRAFLHFLKQPKTQALMQAYGYHTRSRPTTAHSHSSQGQH